MVLQDNMFVYVDKESVISLLNATQKLLSFRTRVIFTVLHSAQKYDREKKFHVSVLQINSCNTVLIE
jgi:hypothetical protein